ncbi:MAG: OmpA family protein [Alphaproteobacteria bacterium]|jgi:chemotaxis protein MotB|nr:OmpA family protein [Alphaproteobacteria bacterium]
MALARRSSTRGAESFIWPGFVDALATLLMVIIFVLMVFFLIQINLTLRVSGQDQTLSQLRAELAELGDLLNLERQANDELTLGYQQLTLALDDSKTAITGLEANIAALEGNLAAVTTEKLSLEEALLAVTSRADLAEAARDQAVDENTSLEEALKAALGRADQAETDHSLALEEIDQQKLVLAALEERLKQIQAERDREATARLTAEEEVNASKRDVLALNQSLQALKQRLGELQALLDDKEEEARKAKEVSVNLTRQLNNALTSKVLELQRFRSEFFGRLREVLQDRSDVKIVGDRFVFQSEVLFDAGSADIGASGEEQLMQLSIALLEIADTIPTDIDWVLQIEGHTDSVPIKTARFNDNWDLSTERALSVVRYLALAGIDPDRLSAAGYGEYQPLDQADTPEARARNRRIEVKITQR